MGALLDRYGRVDEDHPCPVCGRLQWCLISKDGTKVVCQRVQSDVVIESAGDVVGFVHYVSDLDPEAIPPPPGSKGLDPEIIAKVVEDVKGAMTLSRARHFSKILGVRGFAVKQLDVGWFDEHGCWAIPMRNEMFTPIGVQFRKAEKKWSLLGGKLGLFIPHSLIQEPTSILVIAEGASDCMAFLSHGIPALGRPSCSSGTGLIRSFLAINPAINRVVLASDNDPQGLAGSVKLAKALRVDGRRISVIKPVSGKDARQVFSRGGRREDVRQVLLGRRNRHWELVLDD